MQHENCEPQVIIRSCNARQLAYCYGVSKKVLQRWLRPHQKSIDIRKDHKYSLEQLLIIIELIGVPISSPLVKNKTDANL
ncbi:hypothetical protein [Ferruginibacter sp.]